MPHLSYHKPSSQGKLKRILLYSIFRTIRICAQFTFGGGVSESTIFGSKNNNKKKNNSHLHFLPTKTALKISSDLRVHVPPRQRETYFNMVKWKPILNEKLSREGKATTHPNIYPAISQQPSLVKPCYLLHHILVQKNVCFLSWLEELVPTQCESLLRRPGCLGQKVLSIWFMHNEVDPFERERQGNSTGHSCS